MKRNFTKILVMISLFFIFVGCENKDIKDSKTKVKNNIDVNIGMYNGEASLLFFIAKDNELFKKHGLNANIKSYKTGRDAFKAMLDGEVSYSSATEYVAVKNSFSNNNFKILASISQASINGMLAKNSSNINDGFDLVGKKVGSTIGTATEFYTGVFLEQYNLKLADVNLVNVSPKDRIKSYGEDKYDALFAWEPHIYKITKQYPKNYKYYDMPLSFKFDFVLSVDEKFHSQNQEVSKRILSALIDAQEIFESNKEKVLNDILVKYLKYDKEYIDYSKDKYKFDLNLNYPMLVNMKKQALFLLENKITSGEYLDKKLLDIKTLENIDSKRVTIWE